MPNARKRKLDRMGGSESSWQFDPTIRKLWKTKKGIAPPNIFEAIREGKVGYGRPGGKTSETFYIRAVLHTSHTVSRQRSSFEERGRENRVSTARIKNRDGCADRGLSPEKREKSREEPSGKIRKKAKKVTLGERHYLN